MVIQTRGASVDEVSMDRALAGMLQRENADLRGRLATAGANYAGALDEMEDLRLELEIVKEQLARYQRIECAQLHQRRQQALERHRRDYELAHGLPLGSSGTVEADGDSDGDYDTID